MDAGKETATQMTEMMKNVAIDTNVGQHLDVRVQQQMDEKEELKQELEQELQWVRYRKKMLDTIEDQLPQMKQIAEKAKQGNLTER